MCNTMEHRGPDDTGIWCGPGAGIGMTRLAIIDVSHGSQPMFNEDGSIAVVFNGEIYNHEILRDMLESRGHQFTTHADTEVIAHLYEEFGRDCVDHLRGMFTLALWDTRAKRLFIARDRLGIKPLHYLVDGDRLLFASEIKALLAASGGPHQVCDDALVAYVGYGYVPAPLTMFDGIKKLPAGHRLEYCNGQITIEQYWDVDYRPNYDRSEDETVDDVLSIIDEAVRIRLMSEVPLGAFLSGGTDSSVVVAMMAKNMSEPVKTFSIGFDVARHNELGYARAVAEHFKTSHYEQVVNPKSVDVVRALVDQFDEPFADSSAIPTYYLSKMTRDHVTVALSGDGGDELFGGYYRFFDRSHVRLASQVPVRLRNAILEPVTAALPESASGIDYLRDTLGTQDEQYIRRLTSGTSTVHNRIFSERIRASATSTNPDRFAARYFDRIANKSTLSRRQYVDTKTYLCDDILTKVDRTSMLVSLEARVPLLDHVLVEYAATIPPSMHTRGTGMKHILKKAAERLMPAQLVNRPKMGFGIPLGQWIRHDWAPLAEDLLLGPRAASRENFREGYVSRIVDEHRRGRRDNGEMIWRLMMLELWYRRTIDAQSDG